MLSKSLSMLWMLTLTLVLAAVAVAFPQTQGELTRCSCTREYLPVCGVNGVTYASQCVAGCHRVMRTI